MEEDIIKVLLVNHILLEREAFQNSINDRGDCWITNCAGTGSEALKKIQRNEYNVIWSNIILPDMTGPELQIRSKKLGYSIPFLYHSNYASESLAEYIRKIGGYGLITSNISINELILAIKKVAEEKEYLQSYGNDSDDGNCNVDIITLLEHYSCLSSIEKSVLNLLEKGLSNKEIAEKIHRSIRSVDHYNATLIRKMGLRNHNELIVAAVTLKHLSSH